MVSPPPMGEGMTFEGLEGEKIIIFSWVKLYLHIKLGINQPRLSFSNKYLTGASPMHYVPPTFAPRFLKRFAFDLYEGIKL
jgi:hypothetical protein